jgi:hypothetical protein
MFCQDARKRRASEPAEIAPREGFELPEQYKLEAFRGDFVSLAAVVKESWEHNQDHGQSLLYDERFLRSAFAYPGASFDLAPTIYVDNELAAFAAAFPRTVHVDGRRQRLACITFWTTAMPFRGRGLGSRVWVEMLRRLREQGYDGAVNFCVDGEPTNAMVIRCGKQVGAQVERVFSARYLACLLRPAPTPTTTARSGSVDVFLRAAAQLPKSIPLIRIWSKEEAEWQCLRRTGTLCAAYEGNSRSGVITGYTIDVIDKTPTKVLLVDDLLWSDLEAQERSALLHRLLAEGRAAGAKVAVAPVMGYADINTLREAGFRQSRRLMHMYLTVWGGWAPKSLSSVYLDVY